MVHDSSSAQGRWWFGSREKTKDGVHTQTAAAFFKKLTEDSGMSDIMVALSMSMKWENDVEVKASQAAELQELEKTVAGKLGAEWMELRRLVDAPQGVGSMMEGRFKALILIYAHLLRIPITQPALQRGTISQFFSVSSDG